MINKALDAAKQSQKSIEMERSRKNGEVKIQLEGTAMGVLGFIKNLDEANQKLGLPDPNVHEYYNCKDCGSRIERYLFTFNQKYYFPVCKCVTEARDAWQEKQERLKRKNEMEKVFRQNLMNDDLKHARFSTFNTRPGAELMLNSARSFAGNFQNEKYGQLGWGGVGNGKSHLFVSIHHQLEEEGHVCLFLDCQRLFNLIEDARKFSSKVSVNDIINAAVNCDLLTLDELGAGKLTQEEFTDVLFPIINGRQGKLTNYTTNLSLDELQKWLAFDKYGKPLDDKGRLIDRILGSCTIIENTAVSKRQEDAMKRMNEAR